MRTIVTIHTINEHSVGESSVAASIGAIGAASSTTAPLASPSVVPVASTASGSAWLGDGRVHLVLELVHVGQHQLRQLLVRSRKRLHRILTSAASHFGYQGHRPKHHSSPDIVDEQPAPHILPDVLQVTLYLLVEGDIAEVGHVA